MTVEQHAQATGASLEEITALAKRRGFIFPSSDIYGGLAGVYDYGPLGALLKRNIKEAWWREMVESRDDVVAFDSAILMHPLGVESLRAPGRLRRPPRRLSRLQASLSRGSPRESRRLSGLRLETFVYRAAQFQFDAADIARADGGFSFAHVSAPRNRARHLR